MRSPANGGERSAASAVGKMCPFPYPSGVATVLSEQTELLLDRPVRAAEDDCLLVGFVRHPGPARANEDVLRLPFEHQIADAGAPLAFDGYEHRRIGRAVARR